ncbi:hypothetical protein ACFLVN_05545, partial [Chloroflexota bacterium]
TASLVGGYLPCPVALKLSERLNVDTKVVGDTVDELGIRITNCQLGCFKVEKAPHDDLDSKVISQEVAERVSNSLVDGGLPCSAAHDLGRELEVNLKEIGDAATKVKIKIIDCQLNCFT